MVRDWQRRLAGRLLHCQHGDVDVVGGDMGVARGRGDRGVAELLLDQFQIAGCAQGPGRVGVAQVMEAEIFDPGGAKRRLPGLAPAPTRERVTLALAAFGPAAPAEIGEHEDRVIPAGLAKLIDQPRGHADGERPARAVATLEGHRDLGRVPIDASPGQRMSLVVGRPDAAWGWSELPFLAKSGGLQVYASIGIGAYASSSNSATISLGW